MKDAEKSIRVPQQVRSQETRTKLLDAGRKLFTQKGYHGTNSKEIAREAGVAVGSFYAYFKDKRSLFLELLKALKVRMFHNADLDESIVQGLRENPKSFFVRLLKALVSTHEEFREFHDQLMVMSTNDPEVKQMFDEWKLQSLERTRGVMTHVKDQLRVKDFEAAVRVVNITVLENVHLIDSKPEGVEQDALIIEVADLLCRYLFAG
jgi:AcrR family transcriptional regulator